jgi:hypothetical protein
MATPFVTGALALLKSYRPQATPYQLRQALLEGVAVDSTYANSTQGRLQIDKSLQSLASLVPQSETVP